MNTQTEKQFERFAMKNKITPELIVKYYSVQNKETKQVLKKYIVSKVKQLN